LIKTLVFVLEYLGLAPKLFFIAHDKVFLDSIPRPSPSLGQGHYSNSEILKVTRNPNGKGAKLIQGFCVFIP